MSRSSLLVIAVLMGVGALLSTPAEAQYKWRDKAGHIQYSDLPPPPGVPDADILQQPSPARRAAPAPAQAASAAPLAPQTAKVEPELEAKRKAAEQEQAKAQKAEEEKNNAIKAQNCAKARQQMTALQNGIRIQRTDAAGNREVLDDAGRAQETRNTQDMIDANCS